MGDGTESAEPFHALDRLLRSSVCPSIDMSGKYHARDSFRRWPAFGPQLKEGDKLLQICIIYHHLQRDWETRRHPPI